MAKRRRRQRRKWIFRIFFLLLLIAAVVICYFVWDGYFNKKETSKGGGDDTSETVDKKEEDKPGEGGDEVEEITKEEIKQYDGDNPNEKSELTGAITHAGASGESLMIRVNIDQYLSGGRCDLTLARNNETVFTDSAAIIDSVSTSTCEGFNVPLNQLGNGNLKIIVNLKSGEKSGVITGEVNL